VIELLEEKLLLGGWGVRESAVALYCQQIEMDTGNMLWISISEDRGRKGPPIATCTPKRR
jgi:hypothetical protein